MCLCINMTTVTNVIKRKSSEIKIGQFLLIQVIFPFLCLLERWTIFFVSLLYLGGNLTKTILTAKTFIG